VIVVQVVSGKGRETGKEQGQIKKVRLRRVRRD
jgi:hypothetical protein